MCSKFLFTNAFNGLFARWMFKPIPSDVRMFFHVLMQVYNTVELKKIYIRTVYWRKVSVDRMYQHRSTIFMAFVFFQNWNNCFLIVLTVLLFQWVQAAAALFPSNLAETMCAIGYERNTRPWRARRLNHVFFHFIVSHIPLIKRCKGQL